MKQVKSPQGSKEYHIIEWEQAVNKAWQALRDKNTKKPCSRCSRKKKNQTKNIKDELVRPYNFEFDNRLYSYPLPSIETEICCLTIESIAIPLNQTPTTRMLLMCMLLSPLFLVLSTPNIQKFAQISTHFILRVLHPSTFQKNLK